MGGDTVEVRLGSLGVTLAAQSDGAMLVRSAETLGVYPEKVSDRLEHWGRVAPARRFLAQRDRRGNWRTITYGDTLAKVRAIAASLLMRDLSIERPIAILSGNDIEHALLALAAMYVGIPYAPISPAYSLVASDFAKLKSIVRQLRPGLVFAADAARFEKAIATCFEGETEIVALHSEPGGGRSPTDFYELADGQPTPALDASRRAVTADTIAKILFTSGSTGLPKGVINTQRMLCANQAMLRHWLAFVADEPPVLVDWLPWNHTFGGNHNFGLVLFNGGTLYIDEGKPTPAGIGQTVANLREIGPTVYFNVPKGYEELIAWLRKDEALRIRFFSRLKLTFYAGAGLSSHTARELDELAIATRGKRVLMVTSLGATETGPAALACTEETAEPGVVGVPLPELALKLVPSGDKLEARVKGPAVTPGYWRDETQTTKAFDADGFYCTGDALKFAREGDPTGGFVFDGRVSEDFKLATGTWVSVGPLRARLISALAPLASDAVIAGHDRDFLSALIFPDLAACRAHLRDPELGAPGILGHAKIRSAVQQRLTEFADTSTGSSTRVERVILLDEPPSIDANEITDKGSINQRAVLTRRAADVEELYRTPQSERVICVAHSGAEGQFGAKS